MLILIRYCASGLLAAFANGDAGLLARINAQRFLARPSSPVAIRMSAYNQKLFLDL